MCIVIGLVACHLVICEEVTCTTYVLAWDDISLVVGIGDDGVSLFNLLVADEHYRWYECTILHTSYVALNADRCNPTREETDCRCSRTHNGVT